MEMLIAANLKSKSRRKAFGGRCLRSCYPLLYLERSFQYFLSEFENVRNPQARDTFEPGQENSDSSLQTFPQGSVLQAAPR